MSAGSPLTPLEQIRSPTPIDHVTLTRGGFPASSPGDFDLQIDPESKVTRSSSVFRQASTNKPVSEYYAMLTEFDESESVQSALPAPRRVGVGIPSRSGWQAGLALGLHPALQPK